MRYGRWGGIWGYGGRGEERRIENGIEEIIYKLQNEMTISYQ